MDFTWILLHNSSISSFQARVSLSRLRKGLLEHLLLLLLPLLPLARRKLLAVQAVGLQEGQILARNALALEVGQVQQLPDLFLVAEMQSAPEMRV